MNLKYIIKLFLSFFLFFLFSCQSLEILKKKEQIILEHKNKINTKNFIKNSIFTNNLNYADYYSLQKIESLLSNNELNKLSTIDHFDLKYSDSKPINLFIVDQKIYSLNSNSELKVYDINDFKLIETKTISSTSENYFSFPTSVSLFKDKIYATYTNGLIINFDYSGNLIWSKNFNDILKTPLKIHNENLIILLSNKIVSIEPISGELNWEFVYESTNSLQALGGILQEKNHLLYFTLPNGRVGAIDTIFGEKIKTELTEMYFNQSINSPQDSIHSFQNLISYFDENTFLSTMDLGVNKFVLESNKIENVQSHYFINNSLITYHSNGLIKAHNIENKNIFWKNDLSNEIDADDLIINIVKSPVSIIIFFKNGKLIELNDKTGKIIFTQNLKLKNINAVYFMNNYILISQTNGKTSIFNQ